MSTNLKDLSQSQIKPKVLVIDDEELVRDWLKSILSEAGYDVITACNGSDGIRISTKEKIDLFIIDLIMPGLNGFQVCEILRSNNVTARIPILVLTGLAGTEEIETAISVGADDFLPKSIRIIDLLTRVEKLLKISDHFMNHVTSEKR